MIGPCAIAPRIGSVGVPRIGYDFDVTLSGAVANTAAVLVTGASIERWGLFTLPLDLEPLGAPGCPLRVSIDIMSFAVVDASGNARFRMHVPSQIRPYTWVYQQWLVADKNANRLGLVTSSSGLAFFDK